MRVCLFSDLPDFRCFFSVSFRHAGVISDFLFLLLFINVIIITVSTQFTYSGGKKFSTDGICLSFLLISFLVANGWKRVCSEMKENCEDYGYN